MKNISQHSLVRITFIGILFLLTSLSIATGQTKEDKLDELINKYTEYGQFMGSVLVAEKGEIIYKKGFGMANIEWDIPNQSNTKHRLGSITKQFTSMLIIQLIEQGKLELNVPISSYLPDYPESNGEKITTHHLLTHTSGIPNYTSFPKFFEESSRNPYTPEEFIKVFADSTLEFVPGEKFAYSNSGYFLLGVIIEKVTGKSYEQVLQENILTPLKMNNTGYDHHNSIIKNRATGYKKNGNDYQNASYLDMSIPYSAGSLYSTVEDLYLWDQALYSNQLLPKKNMDMLFTPYISTFGRYYGYGWFINKMPLEGIKDSLLTIGHGGGINGFNTSILRIPSDKNLIVLLNNTGDAPLNKMSLSISNILYDKPYEMPKKSMAKTLLQILTEQDLASAIKIFNKYKNADIYNIDEYEMNTLGYQLLQERKIKEAITIFDLNVKTFPTSWNAYDSLGEAYLNDGNKELAIENYKKSVELNPKNDYGIEVLIKLQSK